MPEIIPARLESVSVVPKANVYFDGKVVSHSVFMPDGQKKSIGLIFPGSFKFNTDGPEVMQMTAGSARVKLAGEAEWKTCGAGTSFRVAGKSHFEIAVDSGIAEYICTFE